MVIISIVVVLAGFNMGCGYVGRLLYGLWLCWKVIIWVVVMSAGYISCGYVGRL